MREARLMVASGCAALLLIVGGSSGELLNVQMHTPVVVYDSTGELSYHPGLALFSAVVPPGPDPAPVPTSPELGIDAVPLAVLLDSGPVFVRAPRTFDVLIEVGNSGELIGGVVGDDLILEGVVDVDNDGNAEYSGLLLTGEVRAFGFQDTGTTTDRFDMLFEVTGGSLVPVFGSYYIGVTVTSENSTFTGDFTVPFSGGAKGNIGAAQVCEINVQAVRHTVGSGSHPAVAREPLADLIVGVYDKSEGSCARQQDLQGDGISHNEYAAIVANCPAVATGLTDADGMVTFLLPPGDYLVIGDDGTDKHLGVSASDCFDGVVMHKLLQQIIRSDARKVPGKVNKQQREDGSALRIIEPEYIVWDETEQAYPFIFETEDEFGVSVSVAPPDGFVSDYDNLSAEVTSETEAVQFTVTEVGSDLVPTEATFQIVRNGRVETVRSQVGIKLTPGYARQRGFNVHALRQKGLIHEPGSGRSGRGIERSSASSAAQNK